MEQERHEQRGKPKSGTFGDVYKVWDTTLEVERAFKRVRVKDDAERQSVIREARLLVKLGSHPNIVQLYDIIEGDTYVGLVMDWIEGETLSEYLAGKGTLAKSEALQITGEVLKALEFAHHHNILHSDIKPGNVMRSTDGSIRLVDFGVARTLGTHSMGTAMGVTYPYAPPEFFQPPHKLDLRADLWALGVMLYQLVTGKQPFMVERAQSNNPFAWASAITPCQYTAPSDKGFSDLLACILVPLDERLATAIAFRVALLAPSLNPAPIHKPFAKPEGGEPKRAGRFPLLEAYKAQFVQIPSGVLEIEVYTEEMDDEDEAVLKEIDIPAFRMGRTPVTVGMWKEYCQEVDKKMPNLPDYEPVWANGWDAVLDHPIVEVSWEEAIAYADWAGLVLPAGMQWHYAASGGDGRIYPWGDVWDSSKCHCSKTEEGADAGGTAPVGSYPAGPFGLMDMAGNVSEWCVDWYHSEEKYRSISGGAWVNNDKLDFTCDSQVRWSPPTGQCCFIGFRLSSPE